MVRVPPLWRKPISQVGNSAYGEIVGRLRNSLLFARGQHGFVERGGKKEKFPEYPLIDLAIWEELSTHQYLAYDHLWETGTLQVELRSSYSYGQPSRKFEFYGVRIAPEGLLDMGLQPPSVMALKAAEIAPAPLPAPPPPKHAGGAPPKEIWEMVWVEIAARLINNDLDPEQQSDIEKAIMEAAERLGDPVGEATARKHAKYLWNKVK
jgi:hypothetical protein